jgi:hypothetical protein
LFLVTKLHLVTPLFPKLCFARLRWHGTKHSFADKRVPKCNFGTRGKGNQRFFDSIPVSRQTGTTLRMTRCFLQTHRKTASRKSA